MLAEGSSWFSTHKMEVAQAIVEKHKDDILKLRAHVDAAMENLGTMDVDFWKLEGASLMRSMQDASRGLTALETNAGITKVAGGTASVVGGALSIAACVLSGPVIPLTLSAPALPLAVAAAALGSIASLTSAGTEVAKYSITKSKLKDLCMRYDAFCRETQQLQQILTELLSLLEQLSQMMSLMFGSLELMQATASKALKLQDRSCVERMWVLDMQNPSIEGCVILNAVGVTEEEGADVKMTRIGKVVAALRKNPVDMAQFKLPSLVSLRCEVHLDRIGLLTASMYGSCGAIAAESDGPSRRQKSDVSAVPGVVSMALGALGMVVKSLHRGPYAAQLLGKCLGPMQDTIMILEKALDIVMESTVERSH
ncbi:hypothetical protein L7F22_006045 [Adiantum nelumboides]|nr:hypothetical protein [Adiantum nelumboides]